MNTFCPIGSKALGVIDIEMRLNTLWHRKSTVKPRSSGRGKEVRYEYSMTRKLSARRMSEVRNENCLYQDFNGLKG
jgi:hypothetical protein